jgi:GNAT superfamily N-acetyltransferase
MQFRPARPDEAERLGEMTLAGVRHWGHHEHHPEAYAGLASDLPDGDHIAQNPTYVLEENGAVIGFYSLIPSEDHVELYQMFLDVDRIGTGLGRRLWEHAISEAARHGQRMLIKSDPMAVGFYRAMGAVQERAVEVAPGFELGIFWYDLEGDR